MNQSYLCKLVKSFHNRSKNSCDTLINESLKVLHCFFLIALKAELFFDLLYCAYVHTQHTHNTHTHTHTYTHSVQTCTLATLNVCTFWRVLSGSRAMSGIPASNMREKRLRMRLADLRHGGEIVTNREESTTRRSHQQGDILYCHQQLGAPSQTVTLSHTHPHQHTHTCTRHLTRHPYSLQHTHNTHSSYKHTPSTLTA